ncbi:MAG: GIY-YIG nuclease family protein [Bacteroidales bacterium]|jgi:putative endonuclease|nr:GIY-YIG nuclease family protein [Bacteroidales bacterium]HOI31869.1 GIY-YIG nuclease family protein [Bacteroidales bacterium]
MYYLYILYSEKADKYYVGISPDPDCRLQEHNTSDRISFTKKHRPWRMVALFECAVSLSEAMKIERFIKKQKSRKLIERMVSGESLDDKPAQLVRVPHMRD